MARSTRGSGRSITKAAAAAEAGRRPDVERELTDKYAVRWTFAHNVSAGNFDHERSRHNQARFEALDDKTVEQYTDAVIRGDIFPAVIAYRPAGDKLVVIDGNHRLAAHAACGRGIDVYEVSRDTDPRVIALMTYSFNTRHGRPTSEEERVFQAIYLVDNGASIDKAAAEVNLDKRVLKRALAKKAGDARADEVGIARNLWEAIPTATRARLLNISTDEGFEAATQLTMAAHLDMKEVGELIALLNTSKSGVKQREIVAHHRELMAERIQKAAGGVLTSADRRGSSPKARMGMVLGQFMALPEDDKMIVAAYAEPERENAAKRMRESAERLLRLAEALAS